LFIVEKAGTIAIVRDGAVVLARFLDITDRVGSSGSEQGLLSVAFHPRFAQNGYLFVNYTNRDGDTVVSRFSSSGDTADPASEKRLFGIDQPYPNHNGGLSLFGPDGYLYIGTGDGGSAGDPQNHAQDPTSLLGKMLRIDVDTGDPYAIPPDNPQIDGRRSELWATGLRNPWRFSFDRQTGDLYIADVGQNRFEEINLQLAGSRGGENYGWRPLEANECFRGACDPSAYVAPIYAYSHDDGCSVTGGHVYRGAAIASLQGAYVFGDYCSGRIWSLRQAPSGEWERTDLLDSRLPISSFGEDEAGKLYLVDLRSGELYQFVIQS
jgi:glucose/arabinose dehydrogenase